MALVGSASGLKYQKLKQYLLESISQGHQQPGGKLPSEPELCKQFNVSRHTVLRTLSELQAEGFVRRHRGKGTFVVHTALNWLVNPTAMVGLMGANFSSPLTSAIAEAVMLRLKDFERDLVLWSSQADPGVEEGYLAKAEKIGLSGLIWWPHLPAQNAERVRSLLRGDFPMVMIDRPYPEVDCPVVEPDNYTGMKQAVEFLIKLGHRRIGFVSHDLASQMTVKAIQDRERAYLDTLTNAGLRRSSRLAGPGRCGPDPAVRGRPEILRHHRLRANAQTYRARSPPHGRHRAVRRDGPGGPAGHQECGTESAGRCLPCRL